MGSKPPWRGVLKRLGGPVLLVLWILFFSAVVIVAVVAILFAGRVTLYEQEDDEQHLVNKRAYLEQVWNATSNLPEDPNIVVILFDDLGQGDIGAGAGDSIATSRLDRFTAEWLLFKNGYSPSPYCSASRAGLMTGHYAVRSAPDHVLQVPRSWQDNLVPFLISCIEEYSPMSNIIGIDVSKASLECAYLRDPDQKRTKRLRCENDVSRFAALVIWAETRSGLSVQSLAFVIEPTHAYHEQLVRFLFRRG